MDGSSTDARSIPSHSPSQIQSTMLGSQLDETVQITSNKKKCHGNKKLQRFRKRRRARGMNATMINKIIEARKRDKEKHETKKQQTQTIISNIAHSIKTTDKNIQESIVSTSMKRKRDITSQELNRTHLTIDNSSTNHQRTTMIIQPSVTKKMKTTVTSFIQSLPLNTISVNKNYPFVF